MKKYFLGLLVGFVSLISFGYCTTVVPGSTTLASSFTRELTCDGFCCIRSTNSNQSVRDSIHVSFGGNTISLFNTATENNNYMGCFVYSGSYVLSQTASSSNALIIYNLGSFLPSTSCPSCPECEVCEECPICPVYNLSLAPLGGNTENYVITGNVNVVVNDLIDYELDNHNNALWLSVGLNTEIGGQCTGDVIDPGSGNWSALFINGIQHESAGLIDINIADYVPRDYSINDDVFDLDVGSGYDQDYIDGVIDVQSYRPTSEDFTQTFVGGLILFTPYIVILLFVILVWNLIKKIFKTK